MDNPFEWPVQGSVRQVADLVSRLKMGKIDEANKLR